ncbi:hypothetical protein ACLMJK_006264 [Lecanora helva]
MPTLPPLQVYPGRGLGFLILGASLHDVLTRLKSQPQIYPIIDVSYSSCNPITDPVVVNLPPNGFRLRFDGPDQRLRLIEVLDFTKTLLSYKDTDLVKLPEKSGSVFEHKLSVPTGPTFRHIYDRLFGPTFPGEYLPPPQYAESEKGLYILSYPGIAFTFPLQEDAWRSEEDFVSLLSSKAAASRSMSIFEGQSWQDARRDLMIRPCANPRSLALSTRGKEYRPDEVEAMKIQGQGRIEIERRSSQAFQLILGKTTPQDLIAELGPPDAIHRKYDRRLSIHKAQDRRPSTRRTFSGNSAIYYEDTTDTDQSSAHSITDDSEIDEQSQTHRNSSANVSAECFYNYFHHGFDVFLSYPTNPSPAIPSSGAPWNDSVAEGNPTHLVATKVLLHANVPGSYPFNRYRRCRWIIDGYDSKQTLILNSETPFSTISSSLQDVWRDGFANGSSKDSAQKAMILNRDWGDSPGSSCEILGDWEESTDIQKRETPNSKAGGGPGVGNTRLYGFPGLLFEVLKNDAVNCLTVY